MARPTRLPVFLLPPFSLRCLPAFFLVFFSVTAQTCFIEKLTDTDECQVNNAGCSQICKNTIGSYECLCEKGYMLTDDGHTCKEGGCQFEITNSSGLICSPNFPDFYPGKKDCTWHFTSTPGHRIKLSFVRFEMEHNQECAYDHVELYDGNTADARILGRFCGTKVPDPITASSNRLFMRFYSDASVQRTGFQAQYTTVCGGVLAATSEAQPLFSHSTFGDGKYNNKENCDWTIRSQADDYNVRLKFISFEVEAEVDCGYDYVEVYDGEDESAPLFGRFCDNRRPEEITSSGVALFVRFRSDDTINWAGFKAVYINTSPASGNIINELASVFATNSSRATYEGQDTKGSFAKGNWSQLPQVHGYNYPVVDSLSELDIRSRELGADLGDKKHRIRITQGGTTGQTLDGINTRKDKTYKKQTNDVEKFAKRTQPNET